MHITKCKSLELYADEENLLCLDLDVRRLKTEKLTLHQELYYIYIYIYICIYTLYNIYIYTYIYIYIHLHI